MKNYLSKINRLAWGMIRKGDVNTWAEAFRAALRAVKIAAEMAKSIVVICFTKKSTGEVTVRRATTDPAITGHTSTTTELKTTNTVRFFDVDAGGWRSFVPSTLV